MTIWTKDWGGRQRKVNKLHNAYYPAGSKDERRRGRAGGTIWGKTVRSANTNERTRTRAEQMLSGWVL